MERPDGITESAWKAAIHAEGGNNPIVVENVARAIQSAVEAERGKAAAIAETWLTDWAGELAGTWESYIEAKKSGRMNGRRISPEQASFYANGFRERVEAVGDCASHVGQAIRKGA